ncbi:MAG: hypothetical protein IJ642_05640, partial [Oscillospiraceae bacterium]|nr:hypothetical protein [Oscillospiraceae bacterium]
MTKKTFGQRFLSGLTSVMMSVMSIAGSVGSSVPIRAADGDPSAGAPIFSLEREALSYQNPVWTWMTSYYGANELSAKISFETATGSQTTVDVPDNTYYLLVKATTQDPAYYERIDGEQYAQEFYQLLEINANGTEWESGNFTVMQTENWNWNNYGQLTTVQWIPDTASVEGYLLKNNDPSTELSAENAINRENCTAVSEIEGLPVSQGTLNGTTIQMNAVSGHTAIFNVYDYDGETRSYVQNNLTTNYYMLATMRDPATKEVKGWSIQTFDPTQINAGNTWVNYQWVNGYYQGTVGFDTFYAFGEDGSQTDEKIPYDYKNYKVDVRVYRSDETPATYADILDTEGNPKAGYADNIPLYSFISNTPNGNITTLNLKKDIVEYKITIDYDDAEVTPDDYLYLFVKVTHQTSDPTYYYQQLESKDTEIIIQDAESQNWLDGNGNKKEHERLSGSETVEVSLIKANKERNFGNLRDNSECVILKDGDIIAGGTVTYHSTVVIRNTDTHVTEIEDSVSLTTIKAENDYTFKEILGSGLYYGIVADRFYMPGGDIQSNLAANYFQTNGGPINSNLTGNSSGAVVLSKYVDFGAADAEDSRAYMGIKTYIDENTEIYSLEEIQDMPGDNRGHVFIGEDHGTENIKLYTDSADRIRDLRNFVEVFPEDPDSITNNRIEPIISHMEAISAELLTHQENVMPYTPDGRNWILDTTDYPDYATIYVDGDKLAQNDVLQNAGWLNVYKKEHQLIVFNFDDTKELTIDQFNMHVLQSDGTYLDMNSEPNTSFNSEQNNKLDQYMTRSMVWNLASVERLHLTTTAGIFLLPDENSITDNEGNSCTGWIITDGFMAVPKEWHFVYQELSDDIPISINKTDMNAKIIKTGTATFKLTSDDGFSLVGVKNGQTVITEDMLDEDGSYSVTSNNIELTGLPDGTYVLEETAAPSGYRTVTEFTFDIENGKIVDVSSVTTGDVTISKDGMTLTVMDEAESAVVLSKQDVNGNEVSGAILTLTCRDGDGKSFDIIAEQFTAGTGAELISAEGNVFKWKSGTSASSITGLPDDGFYTLHEEAAPSGYLVATDIVFRVQKSEITEVTINNIDVTENYKNNQIIMTDDTVDLTISKKAVNGEEELPNAVLTLSAESGQDLSNITAKQGETDVTDKLTKSEDGKSVTFTSGENETILSTLPDGVYKLKETGNKFAANGKVYQVMNSEITFEIKDGKIIENDLDKTVPDDATGGSYQITEANKIVVSDAESNEKLVVISKKAINGTEELPGAKLTVTAKSNQNLSEVTATRDGEAFELTKDENTITFTSGETATILSGLPAGDYELKEETAPDGYTIAEVITFTVNEDGTITSTTTDAVDGTTVTMKDAPSEIEISKKAVGGEEELEGATLKLTLIEADEENADLTKTNTGA